MTLKDQLKDLLIQLSHALSNHKDQHKCLCLRLERFISQLDEKFKKNERADRSNACFNEYLEPVETSEGSNGFSSKNQNGSTSEEQACFKTTVCEIQLKLDFYIMEIDNNKRNYYMVPIRENNSPEHISQIGDLVLAEVNSHVKKIELFFQISQKTSFAPPILKPIVFQLKKSQKYAFIFQTKQFLRRANYYQQSDRFFILITEEFLPMTIIELAKKLVKMEYTDRFWLGKNAYQLDYAVTCLDKRKTLKKDMETLIEESEVFYFRKDGNLKLQKKIQTKWYLRNLQSYSALFKTKENEVENMLILAILIYYSLSDFKIVVVGKKETRYIMSEVIIALKTALLPIEYIYPVILASISQNHRNYLDTPVPSLILLWGDKQQVEQIINDYEKSIRKTTKFQIPTIMIDLNSKVVINRPPTERQIQSLKHINQMLKTAQKMPQKTSNKKLKKLTMIDRVHNFIFDDLIPGRLIECKQLSQTFKESYIFKNYKDAQ